MCHEIGLACRNIGSLRHRSARRQRFRLLRISACCDAQRYHGGMSLRPAVEPESVLDNRQRTRYSRQILLHGEDGQARLAAARVLVVGAGGLGSPALMYLAAAGVGTIGIIDDDVVDLSNLHRQVIHDSTAIGTPKAVSAAAKIEALNPDVDVIVYPERLTEENAAQLMFGYDVVLDGSDNFFTRYAVDAACSELSIPEVWGSILRYSAQISVFWTGGRARQFGVKEPGVCLRDLFPSPPPAGATSSCGEAGVIGSLCGQVGSIMAGEAVKLITGVGKPLLGTVLALDALNNRYETISLVGRPDRPAPLKGERLMNACGVPGYSERGGLGSNAFGSNGLGSNAPGSNAPGSHLAEPDAHWPQGSELDASETLVPGAGAPKARGSEFDPSETWVPGASMPRAGEPGPGELEFDASETLVPGSGMAGVRMPRAGEPEIDPSETLVPGAGAPRVREPGFDPSETWVPGASMPGAGLPGFDPSETLMPGAGEINFDVSHTPVQEMSAPKQRKPERDASGTSAPEAGEFQIRQSEFDVSGTWAPGAGAPKAPKPEFDAFERLSSQEGGTGAFVFETNAPEARVSERGDAAKAAASELGPARSGPAESGSTESRLVESGVTGSRAPDSDDVDSSSPQVRVSEPSMFGPSAPGMPAPETNASEARASEPGAAQSKPRRAQSRSAIRPGPGAPRFRRGAAVSKPGTAQSKPSAAVSETDALQTKPGAAQTEPGVTRPRPRAAQPDLGAAQPEPGTVAPKPGVARPGGDDVGVPEANVREVAVRLAQGAKMLDVRESHERAICAIRPSTHIPLADVLADPSAAAKRLPDGPVYVYCLGGVRSMQAAKALAAEGVEVINVAGGLKQWWLYVDPSMPRY